MTPDTQNKYWLSANNPQKQKERSALIRDIVQYVPEPDVIDRLYQVFVTRPQGALGNIVHTQTFLRHSWKFRECLKLTTLEAQVFALSNTFEMDELACQLLAVSKIACRTLTHAHATRSSS